jgi:hypothetical protein
MLDADGDLAGAAPGGGDERQAADAAAGAEAMNIEQIIEELFAARHELAELRELAGGSYTLGGLWRDGEIYPDSTCVHDKNGDPVDLAVDGRGIAEEALRRQARWWARQSEQLSEGGLSLYSLLTLVPDGHQLIVTQRPNGSLCAGYWIEDRQMAEAISDTLPEAIRAATRKLLEAGK